MEQGVTGYEPKHHLCYCLSNINLNRTIIGSIQKGLYLNCDWLGQHTSQHYAELSTSWLWSRMTLGIGTPEQLCQEAACLHCSLLGRRNGPGSDRQGPLPPLNPFFCLCCQQPAWDPACETWQGQAAVQHAPRSACSQRLCSGGRCDVRTGSFWQKAVHNFLKLWQSLLAGVCSENDHCGDPCQGVVPDSTPAPTSSGRPAACLKMALHDVETSPVRLAPHYSERECYQTSYASQQSCFGHSYMAWRTVTVLQLPWDPLESHWNKSAATRTTRNSREMCCSWHHTQ